MELLVQPAAIDLEVIVAHDREKSADQRRLEDGTKCSKPGRDLISGFLSNTAL